MTKPLCICVIDAFGMQDDPACPSCHPAPPDIIVADDPRFGEPMGRRTPPGGPGMDDWTPGDDVVELIDEGDTEAQIQAIFDEQEACGQAGCGGGCSICSPDS